MLYSMNALARLLSLTGILFCLLPISCKELKATVSMSKIKGTITFTQTSDLSSSTTMKLDLEGVTELLDLRIHEVPMVYNGGATTSCGSTTVGPVFDPTSWNTTSACSSAKRGNCAIGDLAGKFGSFSGANMKDSFTDAYLPLSGKNSIYGRTLLFTTTSKVAKACAIITSTEQASNAVAYFKGPVAGTVYFRQETSSSGTLVHVNLFYVDESTATKEYFLKIHSTRVSEQITASQCSNVGQVYNPFSSNQLSCSRDNHAGCPVGDLKTKIGSFNVAIATAAGPSSTQIAKTDVNLPVKDANTIVGRSLVLYSANNPSKPIACTNILKVLPKKAKAVFTQETTDGVSGTFLFLQASPFDSTRVDINIKNLRQLAEGYHVHEYPNPGYKGITDNKVACSGASVGDHLNPYGIVASNSPVNGTFDEYEIGDLSFKYGSFLNQNNRVGTYYDWNLPLFGKNSLVGRSIVIHHLKKDGNKRWICRNIDLDMTGLTRMLTRTHFTGPDIQGDIVMSQYKSSDDKVSPFDTTFYLDLKHVNGEKTINHNWHVHDHPVGNDMNKGMSDGRCDSLGPHFNPYKVYVKGNYPTTCKTDNPLRCELGDSSAKTATYNLGSGPRFYTDVDTPLFGVYSVLGRGFVVHSKDKGAPRQGCADIKPNTTLLKFAERTLNFLKPAEGFSRADFITKIASLLNTPEWKIVIVRDAAGYTAKCHHVTFGIIDDNTASNTFDSLVRGNPSRLKPYVTNSDCNHSQELRVSLSIVTTALLVYLAAVRFLN